VLLQQSQSAGLERGVGGGDLRTLMPPDRIEALQAQTEKTYSRTVWNLILKSVREHPEE
jgi:preprotein translocase subunit SecG